MIVALPLRRKAVKVLLLERVGPLRRPQNIAKPTVFHVVLRDIGKSFQLAITTPRLDLIGYGNATAQS